MLAGLDQNAHALRAEDLKRAKYALIALPGDLPLTGLRSIPGAAVLEGALSRRRKKLGDLRKTAMTTDLPGGELVSWVMVDTALPAFERQSLVRKAAQPLLAERPSELAIGVYGSPKERRCLAELSVQVAWVNGTCLPERKRKPDGTALQRIRLFGYRAADGFGTQRALAEGNVLCRELTVLPPNELTPGLYRERVRKLARDRGWRHEEFDVNRLKKMGAGAFVAVAQGSAEADAAIVHLRYRHPGAKKTVALVGKGICFDTGGHNLKPARYMQGMHEDMNGSAVALGILTAASTLRLPVDIDCWLAIAQNHLSPRAYKQNDVVTALNGTTIEIVHTDAEGRMVLADTLTLAARAKPDLIVDFATLTGSMHTALGDRYSGVFATSDAWARRAVAAGVASGERVCVFPMDDDYDSALDSSIADVKQCTMEGGADHILAARLLRRFTDERAWIHMDLSAHSCKGGLGAVATDATGFGVGWGLELLQALR